MVTFIMTDQHTDAPEPAPQPELFVEFANESRLSGPESPDADGDVDRLGSWLVSRELVDSAPSRARLAHELPAFRDLRALTRSVARRVDAGKRPTRAQVAAINRVMRDGLHYHALRLEPEGPRFSMTPVGDDLAQARSAVAGSLAHYLADHDADRLRVCADDTCGWLFVDRSPAGRRRWCDMRTCGNRAKVARHRARARESGGAAG
jgi:predicted RNA-binding Zn ribbon-like protein